MYKLRTISYKICKDNETLKGFPEISAKLIENSVEYKIYIKTDIQDKLYKACKCGKLNIVKYLISQGADVRADNNWAVGLASKYGRLETVKYLVSQGAEL